MNKFFIISFCSLISISSLLAMETPKKETTETQLQYLKEVLVKSPNIIIANPFILNLTAQLSSEIDHQSHNDQSRNCLFCLASAVTSGNIELAESILNSKHLAIHIDRLIYPTHTVKIKKLKVSELKKLTGNAKTLLMIAAQQGNLEMVKLLLKHGANPNLKIQDYTGSNIPTASQLAAAEGHMEIVRELTLA